MRTLKRLFGRLTKRPQVSLLGLLILVAASALLIQFVVVPAYEHSARKNILEKIANLDGVWTDLKQDPLQRRLMLQGERVDDDFIFELGKVVYLIPELKQLDLMRTKVSDKSWKSLLKGRSTISHYVLYKNAISKQAINEAIEAHPDIKIEQRAPNKAASSMARAPIPPAAIVSLVHDQPAKQILVGAGDGRVHRIALQDNQRSSFQMHGDWVFDIAISPSKKFVATGGGDNRLAIHRHDDLATVVSQKEHCADIHGVVWMDDTKLVTASDDKTIRLWKLEMTESQPAKLSLVQTTQAHDKSIPRLMRIDNDTVLTVSRDLTLKRWRVGDNNFQLLQTLVSHEDDVMDASVNSDATELASVGYDGKLVLWDLHTGQATGSFQVGAERLFSLWVDWRTRRAVVGGKSCVQLVNLDTGEVTIRRPDQTFVSRIIRFGNLLMTSDGYGMILQRDPTTLATIRRAQVFERGLDSLSTEGFQLEDADSWPHRESSNQGALTLGQLIPM